MTVEERYNELRDRTITSFQDYMLNPTKSNKQEMIKTNEDFKNLCTDILEKLLEENPDILKNI